MVLREFVQCLVVVLRRLRGVVRYVRTGRRVHRLGRVLNLRLLVVNLRLLVVNLRLLVVNLRLLMVNWMILGYRMVANGLVMNGLMMERVGFVVNWRVNWKWVGLDSMGCDDEGEAGSEVRL